MLRLVHASCSIPLHILKHATVPKDELCSTYSQDNGVGFVINHLAQFEFKINHEHNFHVRSLLFEGLTCLVFNSLSMLEIVSSCRGQGFCLLLMIIS